MAKLPTLAFLRDDMFGIVGSAFRESPFLALSESDSFLVGEALDASHDYAWFAPRHYIETDERFIHILPYCVIRLNGKILGYNRASSGTEGRLHGNFSVGVGGHIDMVDTVYDEDGLPILSATIFNSFHRELLEETGVSPDQVYGVRLVGILYDDSNDVGKTHIAFVHVIDVLNSYNPNTVIQEAEEHLLNARWLTVEEAIEQENPENWTRIILENATNIAL